VIKQYAGCNGCFNSAHRNETEDMTSGPLSRGIRHWKGSRSEHLNILTVARRESLPGQLDPKSFKPNVTPQPWSDTLKGGTKRKKLASTSKPPPSAKEQKKPPGVPLHPKDKPSFVGDIKTDPFLAVTKYPRGESRTMKVKDSTGKFVDRVQAVVPQGTPTRSLHHTTTTSTVHCVWPAPVAES
jgi:hypothetical protein